MLYFIHSDGVESSHHVDGGYRHPSPATVVEVQADCDELEAIQSQIKDLPHSTHAVQRWYGDHAKFIAGNLKL